MSENESHTNEQQRALVQSIWERPVTPAELQYFKDRWPYIQIVNSGETHGFGSVQLKQAPTGWVIHDYGDAMSSACPFPFGCGDFTIPVMDGLHPPEQAPLESFEGHGTIRKQIVDTARHMIKMAKEQGWAGIDCIEGHPAMLWAAWMAAEEADIPLTGFEPTIKDKERRRRVRLSDEEWAKRKAKSLSSGGVSPGK